MRKRTFLSKKLTLRSLTPGNTEWELLQVIFNAISLIWGRPHLGLFATSLNHKLDTFGNVPFRRVTMRADEGSLDLDVLFLHTRDAADL
jgi:hypothetical protein